MPTTYAITGCSSGIGLDLVKTLAARGDKVYALVRTAKGKNPEDELSKVDGDVTICEGIDVGKDDVGAALAASPLAGVTVDVLINNAGIAGEFGPAQKLEAIEMDNMRNCFEVNTLGPLRVTKALLGQLKSPGGKVACVNTGLGSIADNGSGGMYAYRSSKAAANMVTRCLAMDLKAKEISVVSVAPGFVTTNFGPGAEMLGKMGGKPVSQATKGIIDVLEGLTLETTGGFTMIPSDGSAPKPFPW